MQIPTLPVQPVRPANPPAPLGRRDWGRGQEGGALVELKGERGTATRPQSAAVATGASSGDSLFGQLFAMVKRAAMHLLPKPPQHTPAYSERAVAAYEANHFLDEVEYAQQTPSIDVYA